MVIIFCDIYVNFKCFTRTPFQNDRYVKTLIDVATCDVAIKHLSCRQLSKIYHYFCNPRYCCNYRQDHLHLFLIFPPTAIVLQPSSFAEQPNLFVPFLYFYLWWLQIQANIHYTLSQVKCIVVYESINVSRLVWIEGLHYLYIKCLSCVFLFHCHEHYKYSNIIINKIL